MDRDEALRKLIQIHGEQEKYNKGLEILCPSPVDQVKTAVNDRVGYLVIALVCFGIIYYLNPVWLQKLAPIGNRIIGTPELKPVEKFDPYSRVYDALFSDYIRSN